jgi:hypothetical protein
MSARIRSEFLDDGTLTLTIDNATSGDGGEYRCEARNDLGAAWTEAPVIISREGEVPSTGLAPDFIEPIKPVTVG